MYKKYKISGLGTLLDGMIAYVKAEDVDYVKDACAVEIVRLESKSNLFSDKNFSDPLRKESLYVRGDCLKPYEEEKIEYEVSNPYGELLREMTYHLGRYDVVVCDYKYCTTIVVKSQDTIVERGVIDSEQQRDELDGLLLDAVNGGNYDMDYFIFDIQGICKK